MPLTDTLSRKDLAEHKAECRIIAAGFHDLADEYLPLLLVIRASLPAGADRTAVLDAVWEQWTAASDARWTS